MQQAGELPQVKPSRICKGNSNKSQKIPVKDVNTEHGLRGIKANGKEEMGGERDTLKVLSAQGKNKQSPYGGLREKSQRIIIFA